MNYSLQSFPVPEIQSVLSHWLVILTLLYHLISESPQEKSNISLCLLLTCQADHGDADGQVQKWRPAL